MVDCLLVFAVDFEFVCLLGCLFVDLLVSCLMGFCLGYLFWFVCFDLLC